MNDIPKIIPPLPILYSVNKSYFRDHLYTVIKICMQNSYVYVFTSVEDKIEIASIRMSTVPEVFGYLGSQKD